MNTPKIRISPSTISKAMDYALEACEDYKPLKYIEAKEIEFAWFTEKQLKQLIKHCISVGQTASK